MRVLLALVALMFALPVMAGETPLTPPNPGLENPRLILLQLTSDDDRKVNAVLNNLGNLSKFYGQDNVRLAVVAFGAGVKALLADTSTVKGRIASLRDYEVEFLACGNTLSAMNIPEDKVLPGVTVTVAGIAEIVERQRRGWHYIVP